MKLAYLLKPSSRYFYKNGSVCHGLVLKLFSSHTIKSVT